MAKKTDSDNDNGIIRQFNELKKKHPDAMLLFRRNKHNLFGLTNPRTGKYYEFNHWTESVRAYYTKVQYKYKGGNYLLWLDEIGYAEDPRYVREIIQVLKLI